MKYMISSVVPVIDAVRVELEAIAWRDSLSGS
jgi:hypothetical protein